MPLVVYLDETGHSHLDKIDPTYPIFGLMLFIADSHTYVHSIVPAVYEFKLAQLGHEAAILHSYDIRKASNEFRFLHDTVKREAFMHDLTKLMSRLDYTLISVVINKQKHKDRYGLNAEVAS